MFKTLVDGWIKKLSSRKLWMIVLGVVLVVLNEELGLNLSPETIDKAVFLIATWVGVEGAADVVSRYVKK